MIKEEAAFHTEGKIVYVQHDGGSLTQPVAAVIKPGYNPANLISPDY
jgi:hypothetical protein